MVLPNLLIKLPLLVLGERPPLNLDYAGLGLVAGLLGGRLTSLGYATLILLDAVVRFAPVFHFSLPSAVSGLVELFDARPGIVGALLLLAMVFAGLLGVAATRIARPNEPTANRSRIGLAALTLIIGGIDVTNGTGEIFRSERAWLNWNVAGSATWAAICAIREKGRANSGLEGDHRLRIPAASTELFDALHRPGGVGYPRIAVVLVESWGQFTQPEANAALLKPLQDSKELLQRYEIRVGATPFHGPTTAAEFRELCEWRGTYLSAPSTPSGRCLPELLRQQGYRTVSIHGFHPQFFDRNRWYPVIGFDSSYFDEDIHPVSGDRSCGSIFAGPCDDDVIKIVRRELVSGGTGQRKLVYWLTLSSHFPVDKRAAAGSRFDCQTDPDARRHEVVCILMRVWHHNFENIRDLAIDRDLPATRWLIVGDHRPPLLDPRESALFSPDSVPYIELVPRATKPFAVRAPATKHETVSGNENL